MLSGAKMDRTMHETDQKERLLAHDGNFLTELCSEVLRAGGQL